MQKGLGIMHARVVDSSDDAVGVPCRAALLLVGRDRQGDVVGVGRNEGGENGGEGVHF